MVKKKHFKTKDGQGNGAIPHRSRKKFLGLDVKDLGAAIAAAVVSEIAQIALEKAAQKNNSASEDDRFSRAQDSIKDTVDSIKSAFTDQPLNRAGAATANVMNQVDQTLTEPVDTIKKVPKAVSETIGETAATAEQNLKNQAEDTTQTIGNAVGTVVDTVKNASGDAARSLKSPGDAANAVATLLKDDQPSGKKSKKAKQKSNGKKGKKSKKKDEAKAGH